MTIGSMMTGRDPVDPLPDPSTSWVRLAVVIVGTVVIGIVAWSGLVTALLLIVSIFLHELGHYLGGRWGGMKVTEFFIGFGPRLWSFRRGETEYGLKAIPLGAYVKTPGMTNLEELAVEDEPRSYRAQSYGRRVRMVVAGPATNLLVALVLFGVFFSTNAEPKIDWPAISAPEPTIPVFDAEGQVVEELANPAVAAGLVEGDRIVAVDGVDTPTFTDFAEAVQPRPGAEVVLRVERGTTTMDIAATLGRRSAPDGQEQGFLGVRPEIVEIRRSVPEAVHRGFIEFGTQVRDTGVALADIFSPTGIVRIVKMVVGQEVDDPTKRPTSIVGIIKLGSDAVRSSAGETLYLFAAINMALGLFNLLPVLPLDGGHILIATYERLRSRRGRRYQVDFARVMPVFAVVIVALLVVFMSAIYLDTV